MTAVLTAPADLWALIIGMIIMLGLLAAARWCPPPWAGGVRGCDCPPERRRRRRARWPYTDYQPGGCPR